jgi:hypothetical protein
VLTNILRRQCEQRLRGLDIPHPFCLDTFAATVEAHRGRSLRILPLPGLDGSDALSGAWVATDAADYVLIDADASPWHRNLIGLHEIGHILCDHGCENEQEAELVACLILEQADADLLPVSSAGPAGIAGRLAHALRHPVRHA